MKRWANFLKNRIYEGCQLNFIKNLAYGCACSVTAAAALLLACAAAGAAFLYFLRFLDPDAT